MILLFSVTFYIVFIAGDILHQQQANSPKLAEEKER